MVLAGQEFEDTVEQGRVLPYIRVLAGVVHVAGAVEELTDVKAREGTDDEADFGEDAETAADAIGNVEDGPARFLGQAVEQGFFFAAVVGVRNGYRFQGDAGIVHGLFEDHVVGHGFNGRARFGNDDGHDRVVRFGVAVGLEEIDEARHLMGVDVVAGKEGFREALAFFRALEVPEFAALDVEKDLATEIGTADAEEYDGVYAVARRPCQLEPGKVCGYVQIVDIAEYLSRFKLVLNLLQFLPVYRRPLQLFQFFTDGSFRLLQRHTCRRLTADLQQTRITRTADVRVDTGKDILFLYQAAIQTAGTSVAENIGQNIECVIIRTLATTHVIAHEQGVQRHVSFYRQPAFLRLLRLLRQLPHRNVQPGYGSKPLLGKLNGFIP